jgi:hypothetical protein
MVDGRQGCTIPRRIGGHASLEDRTSGSLKIPVQSNPDIRMPSGDSKIKDIVRYPYIESDVN